MSQTANNSNKAVPVPYLAPDLDLYGMSSTIWRFRWLIFQYILAFSLFTLAVIVILPLIHEAKWTATEDMELIQQLPMTSAGNAADIDAPPLETIDTQVSMAQTDILTQKVIDALNGDPLIKKNYPDLIGLDYRTLDDNVSISNPKDTDLMEVDAEAKDPKEAKLLAGIYCTQFVQWKKDMAQAKLKDEISSLALRAQRSRSSLYNAEQALQSFSDKYHYADIATQRASLLDEQNTVEKELFENKQTLQSDTQKMTALGAQLGQAKAAIRSDAGVRDDVGVATLQAQLVQQEIQYNDMLQHYTKAYYEVQPMEAKTQILRNQLAAAINRSIDTRITALPDEDVLLQNYKAAQVEVAYDNAKVAAGQAILAGLNSQITPYPNLNRQYADLSLAVTLASNADTAVENALNLATVELDKTASDMQITAPAVVPQLTSRPNPPLYMALAIILGLMCGLVRVMLLLQGQHRALRIDELRALAPGTYVGLIPVLNRWRLRKGAFAKLDAVGVESFGTARLNLETFLRETAGQESGGRVLLLTSGTILEGKSALTTQFACSLARAGHRVVVVDANLRRPAQQKLFRAQKGRPGLVNILQGQADWRDVIQETRASGVSLIPVGKRVKAPFDLAVSPNMVKMLRELRSVADYVLVDMPACAEAPEIVLTAPYADAIVYIINASRANIQITSEAVPALRAVQPVAMVANAVWGEDRAYRWYVSPPSSVPMSTNGAKPHVDSERVIRAGSGTRPAVGQDGHSGDSEDQ